MLKSLLSCSYNTRDLGGIKMSDGTITKRNVFWRSDAPAEISAADAEKLLANHITTIIDMRTKDEESGTSHKLSEMQDFDYRRIPIAEGSGVPPTIEAVPYSYLNIALAENMPSVLRAISEADEGVLFYCSSGKDRTGVLSAIILMACGAERENIVLDYILSREYSREKLEAYLSEHPEIDREIVLASENSMRSFIDLFTTRFGSVEKYFEHIGLSAEQAEAIRRKLLG